MANQEMNRQEEGEQPMEENDDPGNDVAEDEPVVEQQDAANESAQPTRKSSRTPATTERYAQYKQSLGLLVSCKEPNSKLAYIKRLNQTNAFHFSSGDTLPSLLIYLQAANTQQTPSFLRATKRH